MEVKRSCTQNITTAQRIKPMIKDAKLTFINGEIKWHIGNWTNDLEKHDQVLVFKDLFRHYEFHNYPLQYNSTKTEADAFIKIYFVSKDGIIYCEDQRQFKCPFEIDHNTLAVAYAPYGGEWEGYVFINDDLFWSLKKDEAGKHVLLETLIHELGHTHNMDHSSKPKSLMYYQEGADQVWESDCENLLWDIYKDDRHEALKKVESGKKLVAYFYGEPEKRETEQHHFPLWVLWVVIGVVAVMITLIMIFK